MSVAVVVPWRPGCPDRERAWAWVRTRYEAEFPDWELIEALDDSDGPWVKARAVRSGLLACGADVVVIADADCWTDGNAEAVQAVEQGAGWAMPHQNVVRLTQDATTALLAGAAPGALEFEQRPYRGMIAGGIVILRRDLAFEVPMDPRFIGWGSEDTAWGNALWTLAGRPFRTDEPLYHLWHPPQPRMSRRYGSLESRKLERRYREAGDRPRLMRQLLDEIEVTDANRR